MKHLVAQDDDHDMDVDTATSAAQVAPKKHASPELEIYCYLLVLIFLIDQKNYRAVSECGYHYMLDVCSLKRKWEHLC